MKLRSISWGWAVFLLVGLLILVAPLPLAHPTPVERTFRIEASRFQYSPGVLQANPGDRITIELVSKDVVHGLSIDGYDVQMTADPGQTAHMTFVAGKPGVYRFRCTATCGNMHPFMIGKIQVGPDTLFYRAAALGLLSLAAGVWKLRA